MLSRRRLAPSPLRPQPWRHRPQLVVRAGIQVVAIPVPLVVVAIPARTTSNTGPYRYRKGYGRYRPVPLAMDTGDTGPRHLRVPAPRYWPAPTPAASSRPGRARVAPEASQETSCLFETSQGTRSRQGTSGPGQGTRSGSGDGARPGLERGSGLASPGARSSGPLTSAFSEEQSKAPGQPPQRMPPPLAPRRYQPLYLHTGPVCHGTREEACSRLSPTRGG